MDALEREFLLGELKTTFIQIERGMAPQAMANLAKRGGNLLDWVCLLWFRSGPCWVGSRPERRAALKNLAREAKLIDNVQVPHGFPLHVVLRRREAIQQAEMEATGGREDA